MHHIKLSAIDSTNDYLKELAQQSTTPDFTVVTAESQTKGRGQMGAVWQSEPGKNLTMSVLVKDVLTTIDDAFTLNVAVAIAIAQALKQLEIPDIAIKWPNDILSGVKKVGGVLIENIRGADRQLQSVIGIGLNVNQSDFEGLPSASSLHNVSGQSYDKEEVMKAIADSLARQVAVLKEGGSEHLWTQYNNSIFRNNVPAAFEDAEGNRFSGMIKEVTRDGRLSVMLEDDSIRSYGLKEIKLLY